MLTVRIASPLDGRARPRHARGGARGGDGRRWASRGGAGPPRGPGSDRCLALLYLKERGRVWLERTHLIGAEPVGGRSLGARARAWLELVASDDGAAREEEAEKAAHLDDGGGEVQDMLVFDGRPRPVQEARGTADARP